MDGGINTYGYVKGNPLRYKDISGLDTAGCDVIPNFMDTPCRLECCAAHDQCFADNNCSSDSWGDNDCEGPECDQCNSEVKDCFIDCGFPDNTPDDPERPNYYCAKEKRYVQIPGDFPDVRSAQIQCSTDPYPDLPPLPLSP